MNNKRSMIFFGDTKEIKKHEFFIPKYDLILSSKDINHIVLSIYLMPSNEALLKNTFDDKQDYYISISFLDFKDFVDFCISISNGTIIFDGTIGLSSAYEEFEIKISNEWLTDNAFFFLKTYTDIFKTNSIEYLDWVVFTEILMIDDIPSKYTNEKYLVHEEIAKPFGALFEVLCDMKSPQNISDIKAYNKIIKNVAQNANKIRNNLSEYNIANILNGSDFSFKQKDLKMFVAPRLEYTCRNSRELLTALIFNFFRISEDAIIRKCELCEKWFVPLHKNEKYCDRISNEYNTKTCKEAIPLINKKRNIHSDEIKKLEKNIYNKLHNKINIERNKCFDDTDNQKVKEAIKIDRLFKEEKAKFKQLIAQNKKTTEEYRNWLLSFYKGGKKNGTKTD